MKKGNILYICHEGKMGGASKSLVALSNLIKGKGYNIVALVPFKNCDIKRELEKNKIEVISSFYMWWQYPKKNSLIYKILYRFNFVFSKIAILKLIKYSFDIVHVNSSVIDIGIKISKKFNSKLIWHFREYGYPDMGLRYILGKDKSMNIVNNNCDKVIFISNDIKNYYGDYIKCDNVVIYNGIMLDNLYKKKKNEYFKDDRVNFLISGALQEGKGQKIAILAIKELIDKEIYNVQLNIAGNDMNNYESELRKLVIQNNLEKYVNFLGFCKDIQSVRKNNDIELVCSNREAFGRVTIEAMMCSNMVIASDTGANPELVIENVNGLLFKNGDYKDLAEKMEYIINNKHKIVSFGSNAYNHSKLFSASKNADSIEEIYLDIINKKGN